MAKLGAFLVIATLLLGGCATLGDLISLRDRIEDAGYQSVSINHNSTNGYDVLLVQAVTPESGSTEGDADRIARLVWETYPQEIDELRVVLNGQIELTANSGALEQRFGPRPQGVAQAQGEPPYALLIAVLCFMLAITGVVLLVATLRLRRKRQRSINPSH